MHVKCFFSVAKKDFIEPPGGNIEDIWINQNHYKCEYFETVFIFYEQFLLQLK